IQQTGQIPISQFIQQIEQANVSTDYKNLGTKPKGDRIEQSDNNKLETPFKSVKAPTLAPPDLHPSSLEETKAPSLSEAQTRQLNEALSMVQPPELRAEIQKLYTEEKSGKIEELGNGLSLSEGLKSQIARELGINRDFGSQELNAAIQNGGVLSPETQAALNTFSSNYSFLQGLRGSSNAFGAIANAHPTPPPPASNAAQAAQNALLQGFQKTGNPLPAAALDPQAVDGLQAIQMNSNAIHQLDFMSQLVKSEFDAMAPDDPAKVVLGDYMKLIADITQGAREMLRAIQTSEGTEGRKAIEARKEAMDAKIKEAKEKRDEMRAQKEKAEKFGLVMKILGPIIAVVAAVASIFTAGSAMAALIAGVIAAVTTSISIADSAGAGVSQAITEGMKAAFDALVSKLSEVMPSALAKVIVGVIAIALVAVAIIALRGAAGNAIEGMLSKQMTEETAKELSKTIANVITIQIASTLVMTTGVLTQGLSNIISAMGEDKDNPILSVIVQLLQMLVMLTATIMAARAGGQLSADAMKQMGKMAEKMATAGRDITSVATATSTAMELGSSAYQVSYHVQQAQKVESIAEHEAALAEIAGTLAMSEKQSESIQTAMEDIMGLIKAFTDMFMTILESQRNITQNFVA
ncbi:MAG: type III secretion system translocon subunit SctE, partial [Chlamydiia bacterium]|nr:type III secretion system translocon subunit SctE [Chlamydiia bacterium]